MILSKQKTSLFFKLSISITVLGALIKYMSWSLIVLGAIGMVIFNSIEFFKKEKKSALDHARQLLIVAFLCNSIFSMLQLEYAYVFTILAKTALLFFLIAYIKEILSLFENGMESGNLLSHLHTGKLSYILADLATVYIVIASFLKIINWEVGILNANFLLIVGLFAALISILSSPKILGK